MAGLRGKCRQLRTPDGLGLKGSSGLRGRNRGTGMWPHVPSKSL